MSETYIPAAVRRLVRTRADGLCEYCLVAEDVRGLPLEVDHVISEKHHGATEGDNLALACARCNQAKGTDVGSIDPQTKHFVRFFNPRQDRWADHFELVGARIEGLTDIGRVTASIFQLNHPDRLEERELLTEIGRYPSAEALTRIRPPVA